MAAERERLAPLVAKLWNVTSEIAGTTQSKSTNPATGRDSLAAFANTVLNALPPTGGYKFVEEKPLPRDGSDQARVLADIQAHLGSRGVDVVNRLADVEERTVRTALFRLKHKNLIYQVDGVWFAVDDAKENEREEGQTRRGV